jgi:translation initiation factor 1
MRLFEGTKFDRPPKCDACGRLEAECDCPTWKRSGVPTSKQTARIGVERRAKGKIVTVVRGLSPHESDLDGLLTLLKSRCGAGGSRDGDDLVIQGDQAETTASQLSSLGYRVKTTTPKK